MKIFIIRHGKTPGNALGKYIGRTDESLSDEGKALAAALKKNKDVSEVFVTPLRRTAETAAILFPNAVQTVVDDLREMDFGDFENRNYKDMENDEAYRAWVEAQCVPPCPGGEDMNGFADRCAEGFKEVIAALKRAGKENAVFVVHGGTIMSLNYVFLRPRVPYYEQTIKNCCGFSYTLGDGDNEQPFTLTERKPIEGGDFTF